MSTSEATKPSAVLYLRAASADPQDQQRAISQQREVCTRHAEALGAAISGEYVDAGVSGNTRSRRGLRALLRGIVTQPTRYVIVRDRTRLARNPGDDAAIRRRINQAGSTLTPVDRGTDDDPTVEDLLRRAR